MEAASSARRTVLPSCSMLDADVTHALSHSCLTSLPSWLALLGIVMDFVGVQFYGCCLLMAFARDARWSSPMSTFMQACLTFMQGIHASCKHVTVTRDMAPWTAGRKPRQASASQQHGMAQAPWSARGRGCGLPGLAAPASSRIGGPGGPGGIGARRVVCQGPRLWSARP